MRTFLLTLATISTLHAQTPDIAGTWQGTLILGQQKLRNIIKIDSKDGNLGAVLYTIDQNPTPIPMASASFKSSVLKFASPAIGVIYEGRLSPDGNSISGSVSQNGNVMMLDLTRSTPETAWAIPEAPPPPVPMTAGAVHIEVATVKPSEPGARGRLYTFRTAQVQALNVSVMNMVTFAYDVHEKQVVGLPNWASDDKFVVAIKPDVPGQPNLTQMKQLMRELLADRFQLKFHPETRQLSVYTITVPEGKQHKLAKSTVQGNLPTLTYPRPGLLPGRNATMADLAMSMQGAVLDRPVLDKTGIEGRFDFTLDWMPDETQFASFGPPQQIPDQGKPSIFQAFQEQLGLKLEAVKAPAEVMVIDKVEKPSDN